MCLTWRSICVSADPRGAVAIELTGGHGGTASGSGVLQAAALYEGMGLVVMQGAGVEQIRRVVSVQAGTSRLMVDKVCVCVCVCVCRTFSQSLLRAKLRSPRATAF